MNNSASFPTYYDILGVDRTADAKAIRQAYLRASLKYHPDKNLSHIEESKARFIDIGKAYDVLKDPVQRANYDEELRRGIWQRVATPTAGYDNYRDAFDAHVAGMSEAELQAAMGAAAIVGSFVGSLLTSHATRGSSFLSTAGTLVGSIAASQVASSLVKSLHEQSVERVACQEERRAAVARGQVPPEIPSKQNHWKDFMDNVTGGKSGNRETTPSNMEGFQEDNSHNNWKVRMNSAVDSAKEKATAAAVAAAMASVMSKDGINSRTADDKWSMGAAFFAAANAANAFQGSSSSQNQPARR